MIASIVSKRAWWRPLVLSLSSAVLLICSFPNWNHPVCAWVALTPWLVLLRQTGARGAWWWSYGIGLLFFLGSMWWLTHLTAFGGPLAILGWLLLCAYLALYFGAFGWIVHQVLDRRQETGDKRPKNLQVSGLMSHVSCLFLVPAAWIALEYLRSHLLTGFGWNLLGYSQTPALTAIQVADLTGVWGVSFVIVLLNAAIVAAVASEDRREGLVAMGVAASCVILTWHYGRVRLQAPEPATRVTVAVVQGNIPQQEKWDETYRSQILARYEQLTRQAATEHPHLIVWPETAVPGFLETDALVTRPVQQLAQSLRLPLLVGAPMTRVDAHRIHRLTNSAVLLGQEGAIVGRYDKVHLVPFGEFIPFESVAPWLRGVLPPIGDFVPGREYTVFNLQDRRHETGDLRPDRGERTAVVGGVSSLQFPVSSLNFGVLICFEDIFPELARRFVNRGAQLLITITNDAWFGKTAAAYQHAQASTLRAVELRVPMVRAANTGWSGCIDAKGRWLTSVRAPNGQELFVGGTALCEVALREQTTFYARWGDWFAWLCLLGCLGWAIFAIMKH